MKWQNMLVNQHSFTSSLSAMIIKYNNIVATNETISPSDHVDLPPGDIDKKHTYPYYIIFFKTVQYQKIHIKGAHGSLWKKHMERPILNISSMYLTRGSDIISLTVFSGTAEETEGSEGGPGGTGVE